MICKSLGSLITEAFLSDETSYIVFWHSEILFMYLVQLLEDIPVKDIGMKINYRRLESWPINKKTPKKSVNIENP